MIKVYKKYVFLLLENALTPKDQKHNKNTDKIISLSWAHLNENLRFYLLHSKTP